MMDWMRRHGGGTGWSVDRVEAAGERVAAAFSWRDGNGRPQSWAHLLRMRNGRIVDMQDYRDTEKALRAARRP